METYKINISNVPSGTTSMSINIPVVLEYQMVDQSDIIKRVFVDVETEKAINPIIDYEKVRFLPLDLNGNHVDKIIYNVNLLGANNYGDIGFSNDDIKYQTEFFKQTYLNLDFYDSDNPMVQTLVSNVTLYSEIRSDFLLGDINTQILEFGHVVGIPGQPKPATSIPLRFVLESPLLNPRGFSEGYHLYNYKDILNVGEFKYLYMRASFINAKNGVTTNLMVKDISMEIDELLHHLYTRIKIVRTTTGYFYEIDDTYQGTQSFVGPNNVIYTRNQRLNSVTINLYQIRAI